jgi:hypothetical protein
VVSSSRAKEGIFDQLLSGGLTKQPAVPCMSGDETVSSRMPILLRGSVRSPLGERAVLIA